MNHCLWNELCRGDAPQVVKKLKQEKAGKEGCSWPGFLLESQFTSGCLSLRKKDH